MNSKLLALEGKKRLQVERESDIKHEKATDWVEERKRLSKRAKKREREQQIRSQDLKLARVTWPHKRPEFLAVAAESLLLKHWSLTFDRVIDSLIFKYGLR
jgi:hypothetical protein